MDGMAVALLEGIGYGLGLLVLFVVFLLALRLIWGRQ